MVRQRQAGRRWIGQGMLSHCPIARNSKAHTDYAGGLGGISVGPVFYII